MLYASSEIEPNKYIQNNEARKSGIRQATGAMKGAAAIPTQNTRLSATMSTTISLRRCASSMIRIAGNCTSCASGPSAVISPMTIVELPNDSAMATRKGAAPKVDIA